MAGAALLLGACNTVPNLLNQTGQAIGNTTQSVLSPVTQIAQQANVGMTTAARTVTATSAQWANSANIASANVSNAASTVSRAAPTVAAYTPPPLTDEQKAAIAKGKTAEQPELPILPEDTLSKLSTDQKGLQIAAQKAAFTAPVGETIFWNLDDRSGTVVAKDEHKMGETLCRSFEQSVTIDGVPQTGHAIACKDDSTGHWSLAF